GEGCADTGPRPGPVPRAGSAAPGPRGGPAALGPAGSVSFGQGAAVAAHRRRCPAPRTSGPGTHAQGRGRDGPDLDALSLRDRARPQGALIRGARRSSPRPRPEPGRPARPGPG